MDGGAGVEVHYKLQGKPPSSIDMVVRAQARGYVGIAFKSPGNKFMTPSDAVIGWKESSCDDGPCGLIQAYRMDVRALRPLLRSA